MRFATIVAAAGRGSRLAGAVPKCMIPLGNRPMLYHSLRTLQNLPEAGPVVVSVPAEEVSRLESLVREWRCPKVVAVVAGGSTRQSSVAIALEAVPPGPDVVLVHDGARPLASADLFRRVAQAAGRDGAAVPVLPATDSPKRMSSDGFLVEWGGRDSLALAQTPQGFRRELLREAHTRAAERGWEATDEAGLIQAIQQPVRAVPGDETARKITVPADLAWARAELSARDQVRPEDMRVGVGLDVHRWGGPGPLCLGGIELEHPRGLLGHSDADVLAHAVCDALLGGARLGDLGRWFPDSDPALRGVAGVELLRQVAELLAGSGWRPTSVDCVVAAQEPRLQDHLEQMGLRMTEALDCPAGTIHVKATTTEGLGSIGRGEGIAAQAVALVCRVRGDRHD